MNVNILEFGAVSGSGTLCTEAIQAAVDACAKDGGGQVTVPAGEYVTGTIRLKSHVFLHLEAGSTLLGSEQFRDYTHSQRGCAWNWHVGGWGGRPSTQCYALLLAEDEVNCGLTGFGTIDGRRSHRHGYTDEKGRPFLVVFSRCTDITVSGVTLRNPGMYTIFSMNNSNVNISGIRIYSRDSMNGDGIDFDGSRNVMISDCYLDTGDDAIGLKTLTPGEPCENITVANCVITSHWAAVRMGPESAGDMRRITVTNCIFDDCNDGFKLQPCEDFIMEDLVFSNIVMRSVARPIFITQGIFAFSEYSHSSRPRPGSFRRAFFSNITAVLRQPPPLEHGPTIQSGNFIYGQMHGECRDIYLDHLHMVLPGGGCEADARRADHAELLDYAQSYPEVLGFLGTYPSAGLYVKNAANVRLSDCTFRCEIHDRRPMIAAENTKGLQLTCVFAENAESLLRHYRCGEPDTDRCKGSVNSMCDEMAQEWERTRKKALETDVLFAKSAKAADKSAELPVAISQSSGEPISFSYVGGAAVLLVRKFRGALRIRLNGIIVKDWSFPEAYTFRTDIGLDLEPHLKKGVNVLSVESESLDNESPVLEIRSEFL